MNEYLEIATALVGKSLTFFIGTGFSKHLTDGKAPNWLELLIECTKVIDKDSILINTLFEKDNNGEICKCRYDLTICAQVLELEYLKRDKNLRETVCEIISDRTKFLEVNTDKANRLKEFFIKCPDINIITTNYDTLISEFLLTENTRVFIDGTPIPSVNMGQNIYHIHGSINNPESIILTMNDYFTFQHRQSYLSRKFYTLLQETTTVILGYSLGDFDLNSILNEVQASSNQVLKRSNIYYITRDEYVPEAYKNYYLYTYGIHVIEWCEIDEFFEKLSSKIDEAKAIIDSVQDLKNVLYRKYVFTDEFLKLKGSLYKILLQASSLGIGVNNPKFRKLLIDLLNKKKEFTQQSGAWAQYEHLAEWLIEVGSIINIKNTVLEDDYLELVEYSFRNMSKVQYLGYSWESYNVWRRGWNNIKLENRKAIEKLAKEQFNKSHCSYHLFAS